jgi:hypothetical protein
MTSTAKAETVPTDVYPDAVAKLTLPADDLLARKVPVLAANKQPLRKVIEQLAQQTNPKISAICFPYGQHDKVKIDPEQEITINVGNVTVGEALEIIAAQIKNMPKLTWGTCDGFDNVLFPTGGVRMFPITAHATGLDTRQQINDDPLLGKCFSQQPPAMLAQLAMQVDVIEPTSKFTLGQDGPALRVWDPDNGGAILWRVIDAQAPRSPETITPELRKQIVHDWKLQKAFPAAKTKAESIKNVADMQAYIKARKCKTIDTGMFARKTERNLRGIFSLQPTRLTLLNLASPAVDIEVVKQAFATLAPKNLSADYPKESKNVLVLPLPCEGYVLVARRIDFEPAEKKTFEEDKAALIQFLQQQQAAQGILLWFEPDNVKKRTGFVEKKPE